MQWKQILEATDYPPTGETNHVLVYANWDNVFFNLYYAHYKGDKTWSIYDPYNREWKDLPKELTITHWTKDINFPHQEKSIPIYEAVLQPPIIGC